MDETTDELMEATYVALCKHGYAALRMKDIAEESTKSKATLHYHYDTKGELLYAFLEYLYRRFEARLDELEGVTATERLSALIDLYLTPRREEIGQEFQTAILEIKAQGPYDERFREQLAGFDRLLQERIVAIVEDGQERGEFDASVDPPEIADFLVTALNGAQIRRVAVGHPPERTREVLAEYVTRLLADDSAVDDGHTAEDGPIDDDSPVADDESRGVEYEDSAPIEDDESPAEEVRSR